MGGRVPEGPGFFYPPSVLTAVENGMPAFDEEVFGPVAAVIRVRDDADAVRVANASPYGLGAAVWTEDRERGERLAAELEVGSVFVNGLVKSDPRLDRKSTRLNSSHLVISYAVFCLKKKKPTRPSGERVASGVGAPPPAGRG